VSDQVPYSIREGEGIWDWWYRISALSWI
jgi:hypothetical protein